jgi:hypothetical protein
MAVAVSPASSVADQPPASVAVARARLAVGTSAVSRDRRIWNRRRYRGADTGDRRRLACGRSADGYAVGVHVDDLSETDAESACEVDADDAGLS